MLDFFDSIIDFLGYIGDFINQAISDALGLLSLATSAVGLPAYLTNYMPGIFGVAVMAVAGIVVVKFIAQVFSMIF